MKETKGFTLIEILIVVAIIAILASIVVVGLGPTQELGRDARRVSDLHEVQNGLELYYSNYGAYPGSSSTISTWSDLASALTNANIGVTSVPDDPSSGKTYVYGYNADASAYVLGATLESGNSSAWQGYVNPLANSSLNISQWAPSALDCNGSTVSPNDLQYCISL
jgi:prepilin-type N-terminal cleavage/methylation domain-containing protein